MSSLSRFKIGLLLWLIVTVCLGMAISSGVQTFDPAMQLSGMMPEVAAPGGRPVARPLTVVGNPTNSLDPAGLTGSPVSIGQTSPLLPIRWTTAIALRDLSELANPEPLLNRPISFSAPTRADRFTMVDPRGKAGQVKTIGDYLRLKSQGYRAKGASDSVLEISAKAQLYPLIYLHRATGAKQSFVGDFDITARPPLTNLLATLGPVLAADQAMAAGRRVAGSRGSGSRSRLENELLAPSARVSVIDKNTIRITGRSAEVRLALLAWGDFNHGGFEEVLISATAFDRAGTARYFALAVLTRATKSGPLMLVDYQP